MKEITLDELREMAENAREEIWELAKENDMEPKVYLHWTGCPYGCYYDDYHVNIDDDGTMYASTDDLAEVLEHTYMRNSGSVGIAMCCCPDGGSQSLGSEPPTNKQIEVMSQAIAAICDGLWLTIDKNHVLTHGEAANNEDGEEPHEPYSWWNDGYGDGDTRGDLEYLGTPESPSYNPYATDGSRGGDVLRGKANWYRQQWRKQNEKDGDN